ncbi:MAG TPA: glycogen-binding domain-containing protein [Gemmatimonadaceae bacterium]|jgi:hypothetical protein
MSDVARDPLVRRAIDELRAMPSADRDAIARVVAAAAAARVAPADGEPANIDARPNRSRWWMIGGVAAAAAVGGFALSSVKNMGRQNVVIASPTPAVSAASSTAPSASMPALELQPVGSNSADALPVVRQFVFHSRTARRVSVVGDFNRWNVESARMTRASDGDLWSVTVPIVPGRHMYGFMVDDSVLTLDPREQTARDADLGVEASVIIVGRP